MAQNAFGFVQVGRAAEQFGLSARDPYGQAVYPTAETWERFRPALVCVGPDGLIETAAAVLDRIFDDRASGVGFLIGPPGTGKTVHALLYGFEWMRRSIRTLLGGTTTNYAMYTAVGGFDTSTLERNWRGVKSGSSRFLWIIDEIDQVLPDDPEGTIVDEAIRRFESERLSEDGHRLLCVGQAVPEGFIRYPAVEVSLTPDSIAAAISHKNLKYPPPESLVSRLVQSRNTGLKVVMAVAKTVPSEQQTFDQYVNLGARTQLDRLSPSAQALAVDLARLRFLGIPMQALPASAASLTELSTRKLAKEIGDTGTWQLGDDEFARAVLRMKITAGDLTTTFLQPLLDTVENDTRSYLTALVVLARKRVHHLSGLLNQTAPEDDETLLANVTRIFPERVANYLITAPFDLEELGHALQLVRELLPSTDAIAAKSLAFQRTRIESAFDKCDIAMWATVYRLSRIAGDQSFDQQLSRMLDLDAIRMRIRERSPDDAASFIRLVKEFDSTRSNEMLRILLPATVADAAMLFRNRSANWMWQFISEKADLLGRGFLLDAIKLLPRAFVAEAIYESPAGARFALRHFPRDLVFGEALASRPLTASDVDHWSSGHLINFVATARLLGSSKSLESQIVRDATAGMLRQSRWMRSVRALVREVHQLPKPHRLRKHVIGLLLSTASIRFDTRLYCVALLDWNQGLTLIRKELRSFVKETPLTDTNLVFWTLWESAARTRSANDKAILLDAALMIDARMTPRGAAGEADLALEGILCSITGRAARKLNLSTEAVPSNHMTNTAKAACQIVAVAHLHDAGHSRETLLDRLVERFLSPARRWQETSAVHRRAALAVVTGAVRHLFEHGCSPDLSRAVGTRLYSSAGQLLWDWYPGEFLQLIMLTLGSSSAARILNLNSNRWKQDLEAGHATFDSLQLLWTAFFLSERHPESKQGGRPLLQKLIDSRFELPRPYLSCTLVIANAAGLRIHGDGRTARTSGEYFSVRNSLVHALKQLAAHGTVSRSTQEALKKELSLEEMIFFRSRFLRKRHRPITSAGHRAKQIGPKEPNLSSPNAIAWNAYAWEHYTAGRYDQAIQASRKAREINPTDQDARRTLAFALNQLGRVEEAAAVLRESDDASSADEESERVATRARTDLRARPDSVDAWRRLAIALTQLGRPGEVISLAATSLKERPDIRPAIWAVCEVLLIRRPAAVAILLEELTRLDDSNASYWNLLGAARRKGGNSHGALEAGLRAVELRPDVGQYWYSLGLTYEDLKDIDNAIATHRRAIRFKHKKAGERLKSLLRRPRPEPAVP